MAGRSKKTVSEKESTAGKKMKAKSVGHIFFHMFFLFLAGLEKEGVQTRVDILI